MALLTFHCLYFSVSLVDVSFRNSPFGYTDWQPELCAILFTTWSLRQAYRHYLHMPHSLAVALASQVIAVSATLTLLVVLDSP